MKKGFAANLEEKTRKNRDFRKVLFTGKFSQLVLMCLKLKEDIGMETHDEVAVLSHDTGIVYKIHEKSPGPAGFQVP